MGSARDISEAIRYLAGVKDKDNIFIVDAEVESVDKNSRTCDCILVGGKTANKIPSVRLMASVDDGILIIPTVGSIVTIILTTFTEPYVSCYSEVESITFMGGDLGGMVKVAELTKKLNNIENLLKDFIFKFNTHTHAVSGALASPTTMQETQIIIATVQKEIENLNITQG